VLQEEEEDGIGRCERREEREPVIFLRIIIMHWVATVLPNGLGKGISLIGHLLHIFFIVFFFRFPYI
jgi:hypothetical protein